jgi:hypothetical protein
LGIDPIKVINQFYENKHYGTSTIFAGGMLLGGIAIFFFSLFIILNLPISLPVIVVCFALSGIVSYYFVFRNDKYLIYFEQFEKWQKVDKRKYYLLTFSSTIFIFSLLYLGFIT